MSESALVRATAAQIQAHAGFLDRQVSVEFDERAPATVGDLHIIVTYGGWEPGPDHNAISIATGGTIPGTDYVYGVDVAIALRAPRKPRDRTRQLWIDLTKSFEVHARNINSKVNGSYTLTTAADVFVLAEESPSNSYKFLTPLWFAGAGPIRQAPAEIFAGSPGEPAAALIRTLRYRGARRMTT